MGGRWVMGNRRVSAILAAFCFIYLAVLVLLLLSPSLMGSWATRAVLILAAIGLGLVYLITEDRPRWRDRVR